MELMTVTQAAKVRNVTRQAIYLAIKEGRLKVYRNGRVQKVSLGHLMDLENNRWMRLVKVYEGEKLYDEKKGTLSPPKAAKLTGLPVTKIYYGLYSGNLKAERKGKAWVIQAKDLIPFQTNLLNRENDSKCV